VPLRTAHDDDGRRQTMHASKSHWGMLAASSGRWHKATRLVETWVTRMLTPPWWSSLRLCTVCSSRPVRGQDLSPAVVNRSDVGVIGGTTIIAPYETSTTFDSWSVNGTTHASCRTIEPHRGLTGIGGGGNAPRCRRSRTRRGSQTGDSDERKPRNVGKAARSVRP
jgi:hypothetical protein